MLHIYVTKEHLYVFKFFSQKGAFPMPQKIPQVKLAEIKRNTDLVALVRSYGIELKAQGRNYTGRCPFHE
ncbi:MAG: hypothetical protein K8R21_11745, partial [Leptospira sp.]|nr:hypothetical protein [Leptospira sp.]